MKSGLTLPRPGTRTNSIFFAPLGSPARPMATLLPASVGKSGTWSFTSAPDKDNARLSESQTHLPVCAQSAVRLATPAAPLFLSEESEFVFFMPRTLGPYCPRRQV